MNKVEKFKPLIEFLAHVMGQNAEIVLHDLSDLDHSVVAIKNNHISGREIGSPATNLILKKVQSKEKNQNFEVNYLGKGVNGQVLRSSSYFIEDEKGKVVGAICVNVDESHIDELYDLVISMKNGFRHLGSKEPDHKSKETLSTDIKQLTKVEIEEIVSEFKLNKENLSIDDKVLIVKHLEDRGLFLLKGCVPEVAANLDISEPSVYRYKTMIKRKRV